MDLYSKLSTNMEDIVQLFQSRMGDMEKSLHQMSSSPSRQQDITALNREYHDFKTFIWKSVTLLKSQIELLSLGLDRHETTSRRKVILLHGVPESPNESVKDCVTSILHDQLRVTDSCSVDISVCHRLGSRQAKARPILVRFHSYSARNEVWSKKTLLKGTRTSMSEFLIKSRHDLFTEARKHFGMNKCWTSEGKVVILLPDQSRRKIELKSELHPLITKFPTNDSAQSKPTADTYKPTKKAATMTTRRQGPSNK
ncbi:uncharacterized protein LOC131844076 [Achroia grisella]|uniref:uncharacterized protein LOC131844076 n=1 Tax=Achroia grisella TaxID=688607 RepID=UPI0027D21203|nr:uncharacterized protein LOC131844076 [Achroia grisella]